MIKYSKFRGPRMFHIDTPMFSPSSIPRGPLFPSQYQSTPICSRTGGFHIGGRDHPWVDDTIFFVGGGVHVSIPIFQLWVTWVTQKP